jgi:hypothetical protein
VVGAGAVFFNTTRGGGLLDAVAVDAATIRPRVDAFGWPGPGEIAYEQWINGVQVSEGYTREQLLYDGLNPISYSPYFKSPIEWLVNVVNGALRADGWNLAWLTDGSTPADILAAPESWTPDQIKSFAAYFDGMLAGNSRQRQKTRFVPGGTQRVGSPSRKDQDFQEFELWLMRRCCGVMGVAPAAIGFAGEQYKVSQEGAMDSASQIGSGQLLEFRKHLYDEVLRKLGYDFLEWVDVWCRWSRRLSLRSRHREHQRRAKPPPTTAFRCRAITRRSGYCGSGRRRRLTGCEVDGPRSVFSNPRT